MKISAYFTDLFAWGEKESCHPNAFSIVSASHGCASNVAHIS